MRPCDLSWQLPPGREQFSSIVKSSFEISSDIEVAIELSIQSSKCGGVSRRNSIDQGVHYLGKQLSISHPLDLTLFQYSSIDKDTVKVFPAILDEPFEFALKPGMSLFLRVQGGRVEVYASKDFSDVLVGCVFYAIDLEFVVVKCGSVSGVESGMSLVYQAFAVD